MKPVDDRDPVRPGHWMALSTGGRFYPLDPREDEVHISDIANGLALDCRYAGQGRVDRYYSVAEHVTLCAWYARDQLGWGPDGVLAALLHDAAEAYINDLNRAVKHAVGAGYKAVEDAVQQCILRKYGLVETSRRLAAGIKDIDRRIVPLEKAAIMRHQREWAYDQFEPLEGVAIGCWQPRTAKMMFLNMFLLCQHEMGREPEEMIYE